MTNGITETEEEAADVHCASCGAVEIDDIELQDCGQCDIARYCSDDCRHDHREKHEAACKQRAAEIRDEILFKQPESTHFGDCPICFLPIPIDAKKSGMYACCGKVICNGCVYTNEIREMEQRLEHKCPFCRKLFAKTDEEAKTRLMKRAEVKDPNALREVGTLRLDEGDFDNAFEYYSRAAELGNVPAHYNLSIMYRLGEGREKCTIWKRLLLPGIPQLDFILEYVRGETRGLTEQ